MVIENGGETEECEDEGLEEDHERATTSSPFPRFPVDFSPNYCIFGDENLVRYFIADMKHTSVLQCILQFIITSKIFLTISTVIYSITRS